MHALQKPIHAINANLESLRDFVDVLGAFLEERARESVDAHAPVLLPLLLVLDKAREVDSGLSMKPLPEHRRAELLERYPEAAAAKIERREGEGLTITLPIAEGTEIPALDVAVREVLRAQSRSRMLYSSSLLNLTSSVELFFSELLHNYFALHPEAIGTKEKLFSFDDLEKFGTVTEARAHYINSKVEDLLRGSFAEWLAFARNTIKISMGYLASEEAELEETFQRRNVVVHNGGIANSIYFSKVPESLRKEVKIGDDLAPSEDYLNARIDLWEKTCVLIAAELWKKLAPADTDRASVLADISYKHLLAQRWRVAEAISTFIVRDKQMPEAAIIAAQLNYWQCKKWSGEWKDVESEVASADYSAKSLRFQLAQLALLSNRDEFFALVPRVLQATDLTEEELREFPIFQEMRQDARFEQYITPASEKKKRKRKAKARQVAPSDEISPKPIDNITATRPGPARSASPRPSAT